MKLEEFCTESRGIWSLFQFVVAELKGKAFHLLISLPSLLFSHAATLITDTEVAEMSLLR